MLVWKDIFCRSEKVIFVGIQGVKNTGNTVGPVFLTNEEESL